jgi:hypothetical protein
MCLFAVCRILSGRAVARMRLKQTYGTADKSFNFADRMGD